MSKSADFKKRFEGLQAQAEHDVAHAILDHGEQPAPTRRRRSTLSSIDDSDEDSKVTAALVQGAVKGALEATGHREDAGQVEIRTPLGLAIRGKAWVVIVVTIAILLLLAALRFALLRAHL
jgi:hypothetical protein